jgi:hypothetical protein
MRCLLLSAILCLPACGGSTTLPTRRDGAVLDATAATSSDADALAPDASTTADAAPDAAPDSPADLAADLGTDVGVDASNSATDLPADFGAKCEPTSWPSTHDFGPVVIGTTSAPFTFGVTNNGGSPLDTLDVSVTGEFHITPAGNRCATAVPLAAGDCCTIEVVFKPVTTGGNQGILIIRAARETLAVTLAGTGQAPPSFALSPASPMFAGIVGQIGQPLTITVANVGDAATGQVTVALNGANADQFKHTTTCLAPVPGRGSCTVNVSFAPTSAGQKTATLTVSSPVGGMALAMLLGFAN